MPGDARYSPDYLDCGYCGRTVPDGAHIVLGQDIAGLGWVAPSQHVMYCPDHCPCTAAAGKARDVA